MATRTASNKQPKSGRPPKAPGEAKEARFEVRTHLERMARLEWLAAQYDRTPTHMLETLIDVMFETAASRAEQHAAVAVQDRRWRHRDSRSELLRRGDGAPLACVVAKPSGWFPQSLCGLSWPPREDSEIGGPRLVGPACASRAAAIREVELLLDGASAPSGPEPSAARPRGRKASLETPQIA